MLLMQANHVQPKYLSGHCNGKDSKPPTGGYTKFQTFGGQCTVLAENPLFELHFNT